MDELNHIPLDEILLMSFQASDAGDDEMANKLYSSFERTKEMAVKLAEKAEKIGDVKTVDIVIESFEKAKEISKKRLSSHNNDYQDQTNFISVEDKTNENIEELPLSQKFKDIYDNKTLTEEQTVNELAKTLIQGFHEKQTELLNEEKAKKKEENLKYNRKGSSFKREKTSVDTLLKKYLKEEKFDIGEKRAKKLLVKNPNSGYLYNYLGVCLAQQKKFTEALENIDKSLSIDLNANDAIFNKSMIKLRLGNFQEGWDLYSAGLSKDDNIREINKNYFLDKTPLWDGKPFDGTLLVYGEQGLGDQLMFGTILDDLLKIQTNVAIVIDDRLKKLFERTYPNINVYGFDENLTFLTYSKHISIGGLCSFYRNDIKKFNNGHFKPFLTSENTDNQIKRLMPLSKGLKIGISWLTFSKKNVKKRSITNEQLSSIINSNSHTFINLQYGNIQDHLKEIKSLSKKVLHQIPGIDVTYNIECLASIIKNCDLVISIDNSTAHLASALGKPVWILLPFNNDFRWMQDTEETIWYKNALLLRQNKKDDWSQVIQNINSALAH